MLKQHITRHRKERKVTKAHLARQVGVSRSYVTRLENGTLQPSGDVIFRLARYFKRPVDDVFEWVDDKELSTASQAVHASHFPKARPPAKGEPTSMAEQHKQKDQTT